MKSVRVLVSSLLVVIALPASALAHVIVTPSQAGIGQELVFNVSVPNERQTAVTNVKLLVPSGVQDVVPTVIPGWTISSTLSKAQNPQITEIDWSGSIPVGQRQDFSFGAQVPGTAGELDWKAYQTYADGTVVHWDQKPAGSDDSTGDAGPYSVTKVVNDLTATSGSTNNSSQSSSYILSGLALLLAIVALVKSGNRKK